MNGLLFSLISKNTFTLSIQQSLNELYLNNNDEQFLQYGDKLYNEINNYDLKEIGSALICKVHFTKFTEVKSKFFFLFCCFGDV